MPEWFFFLASSADFIGFHAQMKPQEHTVDRRFVNSLNTQGGCVLDT